MNLPPELAAEYPAIRLITRGIVTPSELDQMSLDDVDDLNIVLDAEGAAERRLAKRRAARGRQ